MRKLQLLITTYYLQVYWHDMNVNLTLGINYDKWSCSMILLTWSRDFFKKCILVCKLYAVLLLNLLCPNVNFIDGAKVGIFSK